MLKRHLLELSEHSEAEIYTDDLDKRPTFYLNSHYTDYSMEGLQRIIQTHWKGADFSKIRISACMEKTRGCGCHPEPSDYESFLKIERDDD